MAKHALEHTLTDLRGRGLAHIVWGVSAPHPLDQPEPEELWHATVRIVNAGTR